MALGFSLIIFIYDELRKLIIRKFPGGMIIIATRVTCFMFYYKYVLATDKRRGIVTKAPVSYSRCIAWVIFIIHITCF